MPADMRRRQGQRRQKKDDRRFRDYLNQVHLLGLPEPELEFRFHAQRRWRFDCAWPDILLAGEYEGGIWTGGAHTRGAHYQSDCEKYNEAAIAGWTVLRFTPDFVDDGRACCWTEQAIRVLTEKRDNDAGTGSVRALRADHGN